MVGTLSVLAIFGLTNPATNSSSANEMSSLAYVVFAQIVSVMAAVKVKNTPDTPSATGTVNRVVKGVIIHELV